MKKLRKLYDDLYEFKEELCEVYSIQILFAFANVFIEIVFVVFFNIVLIETGRLFFLQDRVQATIIKLWSPLHILKLIVIISVCDSMTQTAKQTGIIVHRLFFKVMDRAAKSEVSAIYIISVRNI